MPITRRTFTDYLFCPMMVYLRAKRLVKPNANRSNALLIHSLRQRVFMELLDHEHRLVCSLPSNAPRKLITGGYVSEFSELLARLLSQNNAVLENAGVSNGDVYNSLFSEFVPEIDKRVSQIHSFMAKSKASGEELWRSLTPKVYHYFNASLSDLGMELTVDKAEVYDDSVRTTVVKKPSAPNKGVWPSDLLELGACSLAAEARFQRPAKKGFVCYGTVLREVSI
ncbi:hypothetical protein COV22_00595, partial [Candidatus Woesearchaeota archaeon CG10_big_fil_rev_8_21_14_0_10_47_5]